MKINKGRAFWIVVLVLIFFNTSLNILLFYNQLGPFFNSFGISTNRMSILHFFFWPFSEVRYGYWLAKKWFLVVLALSSLMWWMFDRGRARKFLRDNPYVWSLFPILLITRFLSFSHWFYLDDFRFLTTYLATPSQIQEVPCCGEGYPAQWMMYLVMRWFEINFYLYNLLGLLTIFCVSTVIYVIGLKVQKLKVIAFLSALFFITTPTYFHTTTAMVDYTGDSFALLLFALSIYFTLSNSLSRSILFAAAALEFGLSRTYFIGLPLILAILLIKKGDLRSKLKAAALFILISVPYYPLLSGREANEINAFTFFFNIKNLLISLNAVTHALVPFTLLKGVGVLFVKFSNSIYLSPVIGACLTLCLLLLPLWLFLKERATAFRLTLLASVIILVSLALPPMFGVRTDRNPSGFTKELINTPTPLPSTGYGLFPALGLVLVLLGISTTIKPRVFRQIIIPIILFNGFTFAYADYKWYQVHAVQEGVVNLALSGLLPNNGEPKVILLAHKAGYIRRNVENFITIYRPSENIILVDTIDGLTEAQAINHISVDHIYFITYDGNLKRVINLTDIARSKPKSIPELLRF